MMRFGRTPVEDAFTKALLFAGAPTAALALAYMVVLLVR